MLTAEHLIGLTDLRCHHADQTSQLTMKTTGPMQLTNGTSVTQQYLEVLPLLGKHIHELLLF